MYPFRAGAVGEMVKHDFDDFYIRVINPGNARSIKVNVRGFYSRHFVIPLADSTL